MGFINRNSSVAAAVHREIPAPGDVLGGLGTASNISYASDLTSGRNMDLVWNKEPLAPVPVVIFFNGHTFSRPDRTRAEKLCGVIAKRGKFVANVDVRDLKRGITVRDSILDALEAVRWLRGHADEYGIDMDNVVVAGSSFGALMALWLTMLLNGNRLASELGVEKPDVHVSGLGLFTGMTNTASGDVSMRNIAESIRKVRHGDKELGEAIDPWSNHDLRILPPVFQVTSDVDSAEPDVHRLNELLDTNKVVHCTVEYEDNTLVTRGFMETHYDSNECARTLSKMFNFFKEYQ